MKTFREEFGIEILAKTRTYAECVRKNGTIFRVKTEALDIPFEEDFDLEDPRNEDLTSSFVPGTDLRELRFLEWLTEFQM